MKSILLSLACLATVIANAQTFEYLDINQVKARVNSGGDLHWNPTSGYSGYECPIGSNRSWGGPASLWMGGLDVGGQLHLAGQTYHQGGADYWPGPLSTGNATTDSVTVSKYNRVWKLNKSDIDAFILNCANGNVQNGSYIPVPDLLYWPGNGDISQNQDLYLAPFVDVNQDGFYDPMGVGDYPLIKGDQAIYTIFNDNYLLHQNTGGKAIGAEIHLMAYAYGPCSIVSGNSFLNYTTFYHYKIINRSSLALTNTHYSLFNDSDIGLFTDDYVGCNVKDGYSYTYNGAASNPTEPAVGVVQLKGPINTINGIDDNSDGMIDEPGEQMGMNNFMYFNNSFSGVPIQQSDPSTAIDYFQYMISEWKDGTPLTCGGNGYGGSFPANFAYPANTYSAGACGPNWTETGTGSDKRFVLGSGPFTLQPGMVTELEYAFITSFDSITNNPLGKMDTDIQSLKSIYNSTLNQCLTTGIKEQNIDAEFSLSPNPTNSLLNISCSLKTNDKVKVEIVDALGKLLVSEDHKAFKQTSIDVSHLTSGIYFVKLNWGEKIITKKFIKE